MVKTADGVFRDIRRTGQGRRRGARAHQRLAVRPDGVHLDQGRTGVRRARRRHRRRDRLYEPVRSQSPRLSCFDLIDLIRRLKLMLLSCGTRSQVRLPRPGVAVDRFQGLGEGDLALAIRVRRRHQGQESAHPPPLSVATAVIVRRELPLNRIANRSSFSFSR